jgi:hypothetical protein
MIFFRVLLLLAAQAPELITLRGDAMARARASVRAGAEGLRPPYEQLVAEADSALRIAPLSVMDKKRVPPSGDKHDYISLGPYWWPDTTKPGGLPYIRRDGERSPESQNDYDSPRLHRMLDAVHTLSLAYYFTDNEAYAQHAARLIRTWFLDAATRMNPHLDYAQAIPGITEGRGIGIIDTNGFTTLLDDMALLRGSRSLSRGDITVLRGSRSWSSRDEAGMRAWLTAYLDWLRTSKNGLEEAAEANNHGSWYDAQVAAIALFLGKRDLARAVVDSSRTRRIARQITATGDQPLELERTRSLHYSAYNLRALMQLAEIGRSVGIDLWRYEAPAGGSIRKALDRVAVYADPTKQWPGEQIAPVDPLALLTLLRIGDIVYRDAGYSTLIAKLPAQLVRTDRTQLLYPPRN